MLLKCPNLKDSTDLRNVSEELEGDIPVVDSSFLEAIGLVPSSADELAAEEEHEIGDIGHVDNMETEQFPEIMGHVPQKVLLNERPDELSIMENSSVEPQTHVLSESTPMTESKLVKEISEVLERARHVESVAVASPKAKTVSAMKDNVAISYPSLTPAMKTEEIKPLSRSELKQYFVNPEAHCVEAIVDQFIEVSTTS